MLETTQIVLPSEAPLEAAVALLRTPPPDIGEAEAEAVLRRHWGRTAQANLLPAERDRNFLVSDGAGWRAVLKFYHSGDDAPTRDLQHGALLHVRTRDPLCPVPEILPPIEGGAEVSVERPGGEWQPAILITCLPGAAPRPEALSSRLRRDLGRNVGALSRALADYRHPRAGRVLLWDMMRLPLLRPLLVSLRDRNQRRAAEAFLDRFEGTVLPASQTLPRQVVHNDLSLSNVLVDAEGRDRVTGIIDFGDIVDAPRVNDVAVAASYFLIPSGDPAAEICEILDGLAEVVTLSEAELALLPDLIRARLVTRLLLSEWRASLFPDAQGYILRSNRSAWALMRHLDEQPTEALADAILRGSR